MLPRVVIEVVEFTELFLMVDDEFPTSVTIHRRVRSVRH